MNDYPNDSYGLSDSDMERARRKVKGPAIGLIVTGCITFVLILIGLLQTGNLPAQFQQERDKINADPKLGAQQKQDAIQMLDQFEPILMPVVVASTIVCAIGALVVIVGGVKLMQLRSKGLATTSAILAMIPFCVSYSCLLGLPFGIWALVAMGKPEVKAAFARNRRPTAGDDSESYPPPV